MLAIHQRERKLIAYEIHDGVAQHLTGALMTLQGCRLAGIDPKQADKVFDVGLEMLRNGLAEVRRLISGLRPPVLDESGLVAAVEFLIQEAQQEGGPNIEFKPNVTFGRLAEPLENAVFRITQECLTNACRYSRSDRVVIKLDQHGRRLRLEVQDWGVGFSPRKVCHGHFGLRGIRERARLLGGRATIKTAPNKGTLVSVDFPLMESSPGNAAH
jgi:signal transduction histidine kinase